MESHTLEVGRRGVFVVSEHPWPPRKLVSLELTLPDGTLFEVHGMVARSVSPEESRLHGVPAGMGVQFYGLSRMGQKQWESFYDHQSQHREPPAEPAFKKSTYLPPPPAGAPLRSTGGASLPPRTPKTEESRPEKPPRKPLALEIVIPKREPPAAGRRHAPAPGPRPRPGEPPATKAPSLVIVPTGAEPPTLLTKPRSKPSRPPEPSPSRPPEPEPPGERPSEPPRSAGLTFRPSPSRPAEDRARRRDTTRDVRQAPREPTTSAVSFQSSSLDWDDDDFTVASQERPSAEAWPPPAEEQPEELDEDLEELSDEELIDLSDEASEAHPIEEEGTGRGRDEEGEEPVSGPVRPDSEATTDGMHPLFTEDERTAVTSVSAPEGLAALRQAADLGDRAEDRHSEVYQQRLREDIDGPTFIMDLPDSEPQPLGEGPPTAVGAAPFEPEPAERGVFEMDLASASPERPDGSSEEEGDKTEVSIFLPEAEGPTGAADRPSQPRAEPEVAAKERRPRESGFDMDIPTRIAPARRRPGTPGTTIGVADRADRRPSPSHGAAAPPWISPKDQLIGWNAVPTFYRLALPTVESLQGFASTALEESKGVFVRTHHIIPERSPAVVCVIHPLSGDEFHLPGEVVRAPTNRPGVAVEFQGVTAKTVAEFRNFIALGIPQDDFSPGSVAEPGAAPELNRDELTMVSSSPRSETEREAKEPRENTHDVKLSDLMLFKTDGTDPKAKTQEVSLEELLGSIDIEVE